jgi:adenylate kinase
VCGHPVERRTDETPEVIQRRLDTYAQQTCPVLDYYAEQGKLLEVRGEGTLQQVNAAVDAAIDLSARPTA